MRTVPCRALTAATALLVATVGAAPAHAADEIELSLDGEHWADELRRPLFHPDFRWVPGDLETETFWVRNGGPTDATMTVAVATRDPDVLLPDDIELSARTAGGAWIPLENGGDVTPLLREEVDQDRHVRVDVRVDFLWSSTNRSMTDRMSLDLVVTLVQRGVLDDQDDGGNGDDGLLPDTGSEVSRWVVLLGAALLGTGLALVAGRRREVQADG